MKRALLQFMLLLGIVIGFVSVSAAQSPWTSVGSAGTVDEADLGIFLTNGAIVRIIGTAPLPASLVIRYNVVAVDDVAGGEGTIMTARFRDNGTGARVVAVLKAVSFTTGVTTTLLTLDSNTFTPSAALQTQSEFSCAIGLDFSSNAYFIEATLTKSTTSAVPALQLLRVSLLIC